jgi:predicted TPR repeat methyltransferase
MATDRIEEARSLFYKGLASQTQGRLAEAEDRYREALALASDKVSVLTNLSAVLLQQKKHDAARPYIERALALDNHDEAAWLNQALYLYASRKLPEALTACERALAIQPTFAEAHTARGVMLTEARRYPEALASLDAALAAKPGHAEAHCKRGFVLKELKRLDEALASLDRAISHDPGYVEALQNRGHVLSALGRAREAVASYREALARGGSPEELGYFLAALGAGAPPPKTPVNLAQGLFDRYAEGFDEHQAQMDYKVPQALFDAVAAAAPGKGLDIVDLGCGTGQCGVLFRPRARTLTGVDLAPNMIEKARSRQVYDELAQADIAGFLAGKRAVYDLALAADVFIYIGDLNPVFAAARTALRPGATFAFSLETHDGQGYVVRPSRRYAQSLAYLRECAAAHGFVEAGVAPIVVRKEYERNVDGVIAVLKVNE